MTKSLSDVRTRGPYRLGVGIILLNRDRKVFVGKRLDYDGDAWQMPQGGIEESESPLEAALRELLEEVGNENVALVAESKRWYNYDIPVEFRYRLDQGKYIGQKQKWFVFKFLGNDSEINVNTAEPEFSDWRWIDFSKTLEIIVDFKKELYECLFEEFRSIVEEVQ